MSQTRKTIEQVLQLRVTQHVLFWVFVAIYFTIGYTRNGAFGLEFIRSLAFLPNHMFLVYSFFYFIIPRFVFTKRFPLMILSGVLAYALSMQVSAFINFVVLGEMKTTWSLGASLLGQSTVLGMAISIKLIKNWYQHKQQIMQARNQQVLAELELLKSQVHPHFLFNTLNNLYAHTLHQTAQAPEIVLKLSNLLRFMIYESNVALIPLKKEIFLLQQYIELEQLRYGRRLDVSFSVKGDIENKQIAPLLLLPLVENAFKHGTSRQLEQCWISFDLEVQGNEMRCKLLNSRDAEDSGQGAAPGGLGLQNVKKRLDYLYHGKHRLEIIEEEEVFIVNLGLQLTEAPPSIISGQVVKQQNNGIEMPVGR